MTQLRSPQLQVLADGVALPGALAAEVTCNNHFGAALWNARLALSADPAGLAAWDSRTTALIEIQISLGGGWTSLVSGTIDRLAADAIEGVIVIDGRDLSAGLIQARTREAFANQTASDVATLLAGRHGLAAQVSPTSTPVGRYYSNSHERLTLDRHSRASTEWDLLVWLAQQEGFDVFVAGTTLYFQPAQTGAAPAMVLQASQLGPIAPNVSTLRLQRAMALSGAIAVTVKSWNSQQQNALSQTVTRAGAGTPRNYIYVEPNLAPTAAQNLAQQKLAALTAHEYVLMATMPGELALTPRDTVALTGTASSFDQTYVIDEIGRQFDVRRGFSQTLRARTAAEAA